MKVRLIAGAYGGRFLQTPPGSTTHPMGERVRAALFNSLGDMTDMTVLDVFAGAGSLGFEALSRGAASVTFVERDRVAAKVINENIEQLGVTSATLVRTSLSNWLTTRQDQTQYDLIFADPPYHQPQFSTVARLFPLLKPGGYMVLSHPGRGEVPTEMGVVVVDNRSYGSANLTFYRRD